MLVKLGFAEFISIALLKSLQKHVPFNVIIEYLNIKYIHIYLFQNWRKIHLPSFEEKKPLQSQGLPEYLKKWCVACHLCLQQSACKNWLYLGSTTKVSIRQPEHSECPFQQHCPFWAQCSGLPAIYTQKRRTGCRQGNMEAWSVTQQWKLF